jgi:hypothetical protein
MQTADIDEWISRACDDDFDPAAHGWIDENCESRGPPLQDSELTEAHNSLAIWRQPDDFRGLVNLLHRRTTSKIIFNNPRQKFLLDAWTLAEFAARLKAVEQVMLAGPKDRWPDGYVRIGGAAKNIEVTIALMPGRKMGEEYKFDTGIEFDPVEDWIARADAIPGALENAISKKVAKRYGSVSCLVVYLNLNDFGIRQHQTELVIAQTKRRHSHAFEGLFVLWKDKIY